MSKFKDQEEQPVEETKEDLENLSLIEEDQSFSYESTQTSITNRKKFEVIGDDLDIEIKTEV